MSGIDLDEVIVKLREDIARAIDTGEGQRVRFELGPVEITLSVTVTNSGTGSAGIKFWVVEASAEGSTSSAAVQEIRLTLIPKDTLADTNDNGELRSPLVGGCAFPEELGMRDVRAQG